MQYNKNAVNHAEDSVFWRLTVVHTSANQKPLLLVMKINIFWTFVEGIFYLYNIVIHNSFSDMWSTN